MEIDLKRFILLDNVPFRRQARCWLDAAMLSGGGKLAVEVNVS